MAHPWSRLLGLIKSFFFASESPEDRWLSTPAKYGLILLFFAVTRLIAVWGFHLREVDWLINDPGGYLITAHYIAEHGYQPTSDDIVYRQFPGLSLLIVAAQPLFFGNFVVAGYVIVFVSAIGSLFLIQYLFDDFRLSIIATVFLPFFITTSSTIFSEPSTMFCFLIGYWVLRDFRARPVILAIGLMIAGYSIIIRQPALFTTMPFIFVYAWRAKDGGFWKAVAACCVASIPLVIYMTWDWVTIHDFFPQYRPQYHNLLKEMSEHPPGQYSPRAYGLPFSSLYNGITDPTERPWKKGSEIVSTLIGLLALGMLAQRAWAERREARGIVSLTFLAAMAPYMVVLLCLGGNFGYKWMERHLSEINPIIDWVFFYHRPLRWVWIAALTLGGLIFAIGTGQGTHFWIFK